MKNSTSPPSSLSPARWPADAFSWRRSLLFLAALVVATLAGVALAGLVVLVAGGGHPARAARLTSLTVIAQLVSYVPILAVIATGLPRVAGRSLGELGLRLPAPRDLLTALVGTLAMYVATAIPAALQYLVTHQRPKEAAVDLFLSTTDRGVIAAFVVLAAAIAPFVEELVFRGFAFNALLRYLPFWAAATASGAAFGLVHVVGGSWSVALPLSASGIVLAYVYYRSGSLVVSMLTHALFNAVSLVALASGIETP